MEAEGKNLFPVTFVISVWSPVSHRVHPAVDDHETQNPMEYSLFLVSLSCPVIAKEKAAADYSLPFTYALMS